MSEERLREQIMGVQHPRPSVVRPSLPLVADSVLLRGLAEKPEDRWPTAKEMTDALNSVLAQWAKEEPEEDVGRAEALAAHRIVDRAYASATAGGTPEILETAEKMSRNP